MNLIKTKLPDLDPALLDPDIALTEEAVTDPKAAKHTDSEVVRHAGSKEAEHASPKEAEHAGPKEAEQVVPPEGDHRNM